MVLQPTRFTQAARSPYAGELLPHLSALPVPEGHRRFESLWHCLSRSVERAFPFKKCGSMLSGLSSPQVRRQSQPNPKSTTPPRRFSVSFAACPIHSHSARRVPSSLHAEQPFGILNNTPTKETDVVGEVWVCPSPQMCTRLDVWMPTARDCCCSPTTTASRLGCSTPRKAMPAPRPSRG